MTTWTVKHGPRRHLLRPWRRDCVCRFETFPCAAVRAGAANAAIRTQWRVW